MDGTLPQLIFQQLVFFLDFKFVLYVSRFHSFAGFITHLKMGENIVYLLNSVFLVGFSLFEYETDNLSPQSLVCSEIISKY